jgi:hypothetical protein
VGLSITRAIQIIVVTIEIVAIAMIHMILAFNPHMTFTFTISRDDAASAGKQGGDRN